PPASYSDSSRSTCALILLPSHTNEDALGSSDRSGSITVTVFSPVSHLASGHCVARTRIVIGRAGNRRIPNEGTSSDRPLTTVSSAKPVVRQRTVTNLVEGQSRRGVTTSSRTFGPHELAKRARQRKTNV